MNNAVLFLDSGVGGLPYRCAFVRHNPGIPVVYAADTAHFPYGSKSADELDKILHEVCAILIRRFEPAVFVIACNTASVSALDALRRAFPNTPFVGTVPAVRPEVLASKTGIAGILGTERTLAGPYIGGLLDKANADLPPPPRTLLYRAAPELVNFVEHDFWTASYTEKLYITKKYIDYFREHNADCIILGCTHFLLLLDYFNEAAAPDITIFDSIDGVCRQTARLYAESSPAGTIPAGLQQPEYADIFLSGGAPDEKWRAAARHFSLRAASLF